MPEFKIYQSSTSELFRDNLYKEQYIKIPDTPERPVWEIFADNID